MSRSRPSDSALRIALDKLYDGFNAQHSVSDPVWFVHRFQRSDDREVVAFIASALAFGRVQSVINSIAGMLAVMGPSPAAFVRAFEPARDRKAFDKLVHRWTNSADFAALAWILHNMIQRSGSIEEFFVEGLPANAIDVGDGLQSFSTRALGIDLKPIYGRSKPRPGVAYFFSKPSSGGACKRLNLFLRWMVRHDRVDLGVWSKVAPGQLIVPLDTHIIRVGRCLGLTRYRSPGWRMAVEITRSLRRLNPDDPAKFDFSMCHIGMMNACGFEKAFGDARCPLRGACQPKVRKSQSRPKRA
ncbi:MAG TPA: TIGR02757 family protein [Vicinamibacterales bacterium]|nr:TIGR02757 family protein [Vicinamibacterales bacterium]